MTPIFDAIELKRPGTGEGIPRAEGEALFNFIRTNNIKRVIETGIKWGFTSYYILAAIPPDGSLISIEPQNNPEIGSIVPNELRHKWRIINGLSRDELPKLFLEKSYTDLFFHDSAHDFGNQFFEYETALPFVKFIGSHDITLYGPPFAWTEFKRRHNLKALIEITQLGILSTAAT